MTLKQVQKMSQNSRNKLITIGVGTVIVAPIVLPLLKPFAKAAIKMGVVAYENAKATFSEAGEVLGDIVAEAKAEVAMEQGRQNALPVKLNSEQNLNNVSS